METMQLLTWTKDKLWQHALPEVLLPREGQGRISRQLEACLEVIANLPLSRQNHAITDTWRGKL